MARMRELEFRAWWKDTKRFLDCDEWYMTCSGAKYLHYAVMPYKDDNFIIEQYTGIKDKNGKEIYEGDIVSEEFEYGGEKTKTIRQVRWCDDECAFELHYVSGFKVDDCSLYADDEEDYEVIGNIHEHQELLEAKDVD